MGGPGVALRAELAYRGVKDALLSPEASGAEAPTPLTSLSVVLGLATQETSEKARRAERLAPSRRPALQARPTKPPGSVSPGKRAQSLPRTRKPFRSARSRTGAPAGPRASRRLSARRQSAGAQRPAPPRPIPTDSAGLLSQSTDPVRSGRGG